MLVGISILTASTFSRCHLGLYSTNFFNFQNSRLTENTIGWSRIMSRNTPVRPTKFILDSRPNLNLRLSPPPLERPDTRAEQTRKYRPDTGRLYVNYTKLSLNKITRSTTAAAAETKLHCLTLRPLLTRVGSFPNNEFYTSRFESLRITFLLTVIIYISWWVKPKLTFILEYVFLVTNLVNKTSFFLSKYHTLWKGFKRSLLQRFFAPQHRSEFLIYWG